MNDDTIVEVTHRELERLRAVAEAAQALLDYGREGQDEKPFPYIFWDDKFKALSDALGRLE